MEIQRKTMKSPDPKRSGFFSFQTGNEFDRTVESALENGSNIAYTYSSDSVMTKISRNGTQNYLFTYDSWGNILTSTGSLANINPFRYRGYYYDTETQFYYLQSRYYNPEIGRFISSDDRIAGPGGDLLGYNTFAYCFNNPMNLEDDSGNWPKWLKKVAKAVAVVAVVAVVAAVTVATAGTGTMAAAVAVGAAKGAAIGFAVGAAGGAVEGYAKTGTLDGALNGMADGALAGAVTGAIMGGVAGGMSYTPSAATTPATTTNANGGLCFVAGTVVLSSTGFVAIEEICAGDLVWAENPETGEKELKEVVQTFANETEELIHVFVNGEEIVTTPEHPFYSPVKGWTAACKLRAGDILVMHNGRYVVVEKIQHEILEAPITVYNFEVADFHTYYVGINCILVHNTCSPTSPVKVDKSTLKGVDVHAFKKDFVGSNGARWDVFKDTANNSALWLGNKTQTKWIETGFFLDELFKIFPK